MMQGDNHERTFRSGLRYMGAPAVSALPSIGVRSKLKSGTVRGGTSEALVARTRAPQRQSLATWPTSPALVSRNLDWVASYDRHPVHRLTFQHTSDVADLKTSVELVETAQKVERSVTINILSFARTKS